MPKINREWHSAHRMPKNPTLEEQIKWHEKHEKNCACRDSSLHILRLKAKLKAKNKKLHA